jgi:hypothetical protein
LRETIASLQTSSRQAKSGSAGDRPLQEIVARNSTLQAESVRIAKATAIIQKQIEGSEAEKVSLRDAELENQQLR